MEFDTTTNEFILTPDDQAALNVPTQLQCWPIAVVDRLFEKAASAAGWIDQLDSSCFPAGASRTQLLFEQQKRRDTLWHIREVISQHALTDTDFDKLLGR